MMFGNHGQDMTPKYPEKSVQNVVSPDPWWVKTPTKGLRRGRLIWAFLPHVDQIPYTLVSEGRRDGVTHKEAGVRIEPLRIKQTQPYTPVPVAGLPCIDGEIRIVSRAKKRPALVISLGGEFVPRKLVRDKPRSMTAPTILVAPYYGADEGRKRSGYPEGFLHRVQRCEFPQFMADFLPLHGSKESLLRLDHIQPLGNHHESIEETDHCLSEDALEIIDEWVTWLITGLLEEGGLIDDMRKAFVEI